MSKLVPMLFSSKMVEAIFYGFKTQTRRIVKPQPYEVDNGWWKWDGTRPKAKYANGSWMANTPPDQHDSFGGFGPYRIGDILWVRETFAKKGDLLFYKACNDSVEISGLKGMYDFKWKPGIHMPFEVCRFFLKITNVRVERLQNISPQDALNEGIESDFDGRLCWDYNKKVYTEDGPVESYRTLWQVINGPDSWDANPWVYVIEFEEIDKEEALNLIK